MGAAPRALAVAAVVVAAGLHAAPADAATAATGSIVVKNCFTTLDGVQLRVKMRFDMRSATDANGVRQVRVRVSHPRGTDNFENHRVRSVATGLIFESAATDPQIGGAAFAESRGDKPAYRKRLNADMASVTAAVTFRLTNGKRTAIGCTQQFPG